MDSFRNIESVLTLHSHDEIFHIGIKSRTARLMGRPFPLSEAAMPFQDCLWADDQEGLPPSFESQGKLAEDSTDNRVQDRPLGLALKDEELIPEKEVFLLEIIESWVQRPKKDCKATTGKLLDLHGSRESSEERRLA